MEQEMFVNNLCHPFPTYENRLYLWPIDLDRDNQLMKDSLPIKFELLKQSILSYLLQKPMYQSTNKWKAICPSFRRRKEGDNRFYTCNAMAICTNHSTTCLSSSGTPFCSFSLVYRSPPSQNCMAMCRYPSFWNESLYVTMFGCLSLDSSLASCSAECCSRFDAFLRFILLSTYWNREKNILVAQNDTT